MSKTILITQKGGIAEIILSRPERLNAINDDLLKELSAALKSVNQDRDVGVVILRGAGRAFCAGDDLKDAANRQGMPEAEIRRYLEDIQEITRLIMLNEKVVIGAIHGWAAGGGFEWVLNCDFTIMAASTRCFFPEVGLGIFVTGGISSILPNLVGLQKAKELILLGEKVDAHTALDLGIAWKVVPEESLLDEAYDLAKRLMAMPHIARGRAKKALNLSASLPLDQAMDLETLVTTEGMLDPDTAARAGAALAK
ncbi:MAG: enoyl-CoA hydratase/isomerase family protein [Gammaproteobacteria bacterium]|nr:enoyl-CoA hydratase/isomerase family protein [Gammaproteobacteria bacterium]